MKAHFVSLGCIEFHGVIQLLQKCTFNSSGLQFSLALYCHTVGKGFQNNFIVLPVSFEFCFKFKI